MFFLYIYFLSIKLVGRLVSFYTQILIPNVFEVKKFIFVDVNGGTFVASAVCGTYFKFSRDLEVFFLIIFCVRYSIFFSGEYELSYIALWNFRL
jgi:hypothetical protein